MEKMKQLIEKAKSLFKKRPRIVFGIVVVLALSLPFVINQVLKQQDIRQRASTAPSITFNFLDPVRTVHVGDTVTLWLVMNAGVNDIGSFHYKIDYTKGLVSDIKSIPTNIYTIIMNKYEDGIFELSAVNPTITQITGNNINIVKFEFKPSQVGKMKINVNDIQATASTYDTYVPIDNQNNILADITIVDAQTVIPSTAPTSTTAPPPPLSPTEPDIRLSPTATPAVSAPAPPPTSPNPTLGRETPAPTAPNDNCLLKPRGDANCDGKVNPSDFIIWKNEYTGLTTKTADFNSSGDVTPTDFIIWKNGYLDSSIAH